MKTSHGAPRSERNARFWDWMARRGVPLGDFSTDECVERALPYLQAARADLTAELAARPNGKLQDTLADLDTIIGRRPVARVTNANAATATSAGAPNQADNSLAGLLRAAKERR